MAQNARHNKVEATKVRRVSMIIIISLIISFVIFLIIATTLVFTDKPSLKDSAASVPMTFQEAIDVDYTTLPELEKVEMRNGSDVSIRRYDGGSDRLIVLVHGSGWHGMQFHVMASEFAKRKLGTVVVPDLRGHGIDPERRGDVDYIGQLEDDIADIITAEKKQQAYGAVVLGGHSSGGGLAVRFMGGKHGSMADQVVLMAPFLKYNAPTTKENSGGWAQPATRRIVGLSMLNTFGITLFNDKPVINFAMPREVLDGPYGGTATTQYSYRLNTAFAPRSNYTADLAKITQPLLVIAGEDDEAFHVDRYERVISPHAKNGTYFTVPNVNHIGVTVDNKAVGYIGDWTERL